MDFGTNNPTVCLWVAVDHDDNYYVIDEHYESRQTVEYHAGRILSKTGNRVIQSTWGDPSATQWIKEFSERGIYVSKANKEKGTASGKWVGYGINMLSEKLRPVPGKIVDIVGLRDRDWET